jgi:sugar phosphate isomerase/epimerase
MKISIVTDEISADLETAIELAVEWGVSDLELRGFGTQRIPLFSDFQKQRVRELLEEYNARVVAISPGLFKIPHPSKKRERFPLQVFDANLYQKWQDSRSLLDYHLHELLPASFEYAREIGADKIIIFGFDRGSNAAGPAPDEILESLQWAAGQAEQSGLQLVIEVEEGFWADTGRRTAELVRAINRPALGVNWDPGNAVMAGDIPYPDGYQAVREILRHVHFKDVVHTAKGGYRYEVNGEIDWSGQINALAADGYGGFISVEPHMQPKIASAKALTVRLQELIAAAPHPIIPRA